MKKKEVFDKLGNYINIDVNSLVHNFFFLKKSLHEKVKIIAMVKSNAYGHGLVPISHHLQSLGIDYFGVFTIAEGVQLRNSGINKDIIIFGPFLEQNIPEIKEHSLSLVVGSYDEIEILMKYNDKKKIKIHIKIDTGMGRIGFLPKDSFKIIQNMHGKNSSLLLDGLCTHFSDSSSPDVDYTLFQGHQFNDLIEQLKAKGISFPLIHASNSAAILRYPEFHYNCVRPGILLYGIDPFINQYDLHPILSLHSYVSSVKIVPEFSYISYCRTFQTQKETKIAIIPFGYADGYMWDLSNKTFVSIHGKLYPIIGNICMNQFVVDISNSDDVFIYDPVTLIEADNQSKIGLNQLAMSSEKIPYEILCRLSETIHRNYRLR